MSDREPRGLRWVLFSRVTSPGFTVVELVVVLMIIGILAAAASPIYLGYARDAKTTEAKGLAAALWTAVTTNALSACDAPATVAAGYPRAGLGTTGSTVPARWAATGGSNSITSDCATGAIAPDGDVFTIVGVATDVSEIRVKFVYAASGTPPSQLRCSTNSGTSFGDC